MNINKLRLLCLPAMLIPAGLLVISSQAKSENHAAKPTLDELREKAAKVMALRDNVAARGRIREVWNLVDRLDQLGKTKEMSKYLEFGLKHDPWALKYQLLYAKILKSKGQQYKATEKAELVANYAETDDLINGAYALLGKKPIPKIPPISTIEADDYALIIVPIGEVDTWLLWRLERSLHEVLGIPVYIKDASIPLPTPKRNRLKQFIDLNRRVMAFNKMMAADIKEILAELNLDEKALEKDEIVIKVMRILAEKKGGEKAVQEYEQFLKRAEQMDRQWDMSDLLKNIRKAIYPYKKSKIGFLGVAKVDVFSHNTNYVFGTGVRGKQYGIISYCRFTTDFNNDPPNSDRLYQRTLKQAISTTGNMYGLPRCTSPICVRAYPNNLAEHDAKSAVLCQTCKEGFQKIFHAKKKEPNTF